MVAQVDFTNWYWVHEEEREDTPDPDDPDAEQAYLDELDEHWWHRSFVIQIRSPDGVMVGKMKFWMMDISRITEHFHMTLDEFSMEHYQLSQLFNNSGRFHRSIGRTGTRLWRDLDIDSGDDEWLICLTDIDIDVEYRNKGVARWALSKLWDVGELHDTASKYIFAWPCPTGRVFQDASTMEQIRMRASVERLFRDSHYRRVGTSSFFALARDKNHRSHSFPAHGDAEYVEDDPDVEYTDDSS